MVFGGAQRQPFLMSDPIGLKCLAGSWNKQTGGRKKKSQTKRRKLKHISLQPTARISGAHCLQRSHQGHAAADYFPHLLIWMPRSFSSSSPYLLFSRHSLRLYIISHLTRDFTTRGTHLPDSAASTHRKLTIEKISNLTERGSKRQVKPVIVCLDSRLI